MMDPSHALVESAPVLPGDGAAAPVAAQASGAMTPLEAPVASPPAAGPAALAPSPAGMEGHGHGESMHEPHSEATHDLSHVRPWSPEPPECFCRCVMLIGSVSTWFA